MNNDIVKLSTIRRMYPALIAEELASVQPININMKELMEALSQPHTLNCSCGTTLLKTEGFFKETEVTCKCGKTWQFNPVCRDFGLTWIWKEKIGANKMSDDLFTQITKKIVDYRVEFGHHPKYIIFGMASYQILLNRIQRDGDCGYSVVISSNKKKQKLKRLMGVIVLKCPTAISDGFILAEGA